MTALRALLLPTYATLVETEARDAEEEGGRTARDRLAGRRPELAVKILGEIGVPATIGPVESCEKCGFFECVCAARTKHAPSCRLLRAMSMWVSIPCEHDRDVCPTCDACDCGAEGGK